MRSCHIEVKDVEGKPTAFLWNGGTIGEGLVTYLFPRCLYKQVNDLGFYKLTAFDKPVKNSSTFQVFVFEAGEGIAGSYVSTNSGICGAFLDTLLSPGWKFGEEKLRTVHFKIKKIETWAAKNTKSSRPRSGRGR